MRSLVLAAHLGIALTASAGCFDFSELTECHNSTAHVCDDFETGTQSTAWSILDEGAATGLIETGHAHDSDRAVHLHSSTQVGELWALRWEELDQQATAHAFVRAFVFAPMPPSGGSVTLYNMIEDVAPFEGVRILFEEADGLRLHNGVGTPDATTEGRFPYGRWACVEWEVESANAGAMNLWIDDELVAQTAGDTLPVTKLGKVTIGVITQTALTSSFELWIDDVIVDDKRITCVQ